MKGLFNWFHNNPWPREEKQNDNSFFKHKSNQFLYFSNCFSFVIGSKMQKAKWQVQDLIRTK